tara:strand:- start:431 stop:1819 length:1389 start_codon:yes stop_codon:yes gene_type:complete
MDVKTSAVRLKTVSATPFCMTQTIELDDIKDKFLAHVVPKVAIFWDCDSVSYDLKTGKELLTQDVKIHPAFAHVHSVPKTATLGIYVHGLFVSSFVDLPHALFMAGKGSTVNVISRDRNSVDKDLLPFRVRAMVKSAPVLRGGRLVSAFAHLMHGASAETDEWLMQASWSNFWRRVFHNTNVKYLYAHLLLMDVEEDAPPVFVHSLDNLCGWVKATIASNYLPIDVVSADADHVLFPRTAPDDLKTYILHKEREAITGPPMGGPDMLGAFGTEFLRRYDDNNKSVSFHAINPSHMEDDYMELVNMGNHKIAIVTSVASGSPKKHTLMALTFHLTRHVSHLNRATTDAFRKIQERIALLDEDTAITSKSKLDSLFSEQAPLASTKTHRSSPDSTHHMPSDLPTAHNEVHKQDGTGSDDSTVGATSVPSVETLGTSVIEALAAVPQLDAVIKVLQASNKRKRGV